MQSTLAQTGGSKKSRGETCRQLRPRQQIGIETSGRRAIGIPSILHGLTIREFFRVRTSFGCLEKNFQTNDGEEVNRTPLIQHVQMRTVMITFHHANTRGSRASRLRIAHLYVPKTNVIHVSCLVPCRTDTDHKHKFSLTYLSDVLSLTHQVLWRTIYIYPAKMHGRVADQHKSHLSHYFCSKENHSTRLPRKMLVLVFFFYLVLWLH